MKKLIPTGMLMLLNVLWVYAQDCIQFPTFSIERTSDNCDFEIELCIDVMNVDTRAIEYYLSYPTNDGTMITDMQTMASSAAFSFGQYCQTFNLYDVDCGAEFSAYTRGYHHVDCGEDNLCGKSEEINFNDNVVALPIELVAFNATKKESSNLIEWTTAKEENVLFHQLQKSANGSSDFEIIYEVLSTGDSQGRTEYFYQDKELSPIAYYQLVTVDFDGIEQRSPVTVIDRKEEMFDQVKIFPVPAFNELNVVVDTYENKPLEIRITDLQGKEVFKETFFLSNGRHLQKLNLSSLNNNNMYFVTLDNTRDRHVRKFVKAGL